MGLLGGRQPTKLFPCWKEAKLSSFPWLASPPDSACATSRQAPSAGQGTGGTGRGTAHCPQAPGFAVAQAALEMGLK